MKKLFAGLCFAALCYSSLPAEIKHPLIVNPIHIGMFTIGSMYHQDPVYDVISLGSFTWASGTTIGGAINIGNIHSKKEIFVVSTITGASLTLTAASSTVAGVTVTKGTTEYSTASGTRSIAFVSLPTQGGSQTVTMTFSGTPTSGAISVYKVLNRPNIGNNHVSTNGATGVSATSGAAGAITLLTNDITFGAHYHTNNNATTTPTGTTQGLDISSGANQVQTCFRKPVSSGSSPNDSWSWTTNANWGSSIWGFR